MPPYLWRKLTPQDRREVLAARKIRRRPWHSPPHCASLTTSHYHMTAACFEHQPFIGSTPERMDSFTDALLANFTAADTRAFAWCVLPNHYHALVEAPDVLLLIRNLGRLHGRTSHAWNTDDNARGRQLFFRAVEREIRSERHFWATLNYVHHNPVRHGYVEKWTDWPWSSAADYLGEVGRETAANIWREYPVLDYGEGWDAAEL
ncbi:MAG: REP-associated tyrosine transposase [Tepidisphaerales bacterium]